jgi:hypothetical protein
MMKLLTLALLTALITGCGTRGYLKEGATYDDLLSNLSLIGNFVNLSQLRCTL